MSMCVFLSIFMICVMYIMYVCVCRQREREGERKSQVFKSYRPGASCPSGPKTGKVL